MQADFDPGTGRISFSQLGVPHTFIQGGVAWVRYQRLNSNRLCKVTFDGREGSVEERRIEDIHGKGLQRGIRRLPTQDGIELTYRINSYDELPFLLLQLSIHNLGTEPILLQEACIFQAAPSAGGKVQLDESTEELRFFKVGWHGWDYTGLRRHTECNSSSWIDRFTSASYSNPVTTRPNGRGEFCSEGWAVLAGKAACLVAGFTSTAQQFGQVYACARPGEHALSLITQMDGVRLDAGETRDSEWGFLQFVPLPEAAPEIDYVKAVARQMRPRLPATPPPPMWTHWYRYYHNITEQLFLQNLEVLANVRGSIPYQVVELDDGYQQAWGDWTNTNARFPHGLEWLASQIISKGFTPGLWLAPFAVQDKSGIAREHPDWLVKNQQGKPANAGFQYNMVIKALDLSHPEVLEHLRQLAFTLTQEWGYGMLKLDFINAGALPGKRLNPKLTRAEGLRMGLEAIRQGTGDETFLLGSGCPFGSAIGLVDAMRIGPDTAPSWEPWLHWLPWVSPLTKNNPSMPALRNALRNTLNLSSLHQHWWWNDPDCLLVRDIDSRLTEAEVQSAVSLVGLSGGLLISSDDMRSVAPERLAWVSKLVPNLGMRGLPLDTMEREMPRLYRVKLEAAEKAWQLVALFNWEDHPADLILRFRELGYKTGADLHVFDFWARKYHRSQVSEMKFRDVPAHGCKLVRICEVGTSPRLVGDTLHISQGAEISSIHIEEGRMVLETVDMGRNVEGEMWFWLPSPPNGVMCNAKSVKVITVMEGIYVLHVSFVGRGRVELNLALG